MRIFLYTVGIYIGLDVILSSGNKDCLKLPRVICHELTCPEIQQEMKGFFNN